MIGNTKYADLWVYPPDKSNKNNFHLIYSVVDRHKHKGLEKLLFIELNKWLKKNHSHYEVTTALYDSSTEDQNVLIAHGFEKFSGQIIKVENGTPYTEVKFRKTGQNNSNIEIAKVMGEKVILMTLPKNKSNLISFEAKMKEKLVAHLTVTPHRDKAQAVVAFYIDANFLNFDIENAMMRKLGDWAELQSEIKTLHSTFFAEDKWLRILFEKFGFKNIGAKPRSRLRQDRYVKVIHY